MKDDRAKWMAFSGIVCVAAIITVLSVIKEESAKEKVPENLPVLVWLEKSKADQGGFLSFCVSDRWDYQRAVFYDEAYDGTLNYVDAIGKDKVHRIYCYDGRMHLTLECVYCTADEWQVWLDRFKEVREESLKPPKFGG